MFELILLSALLSAACSQLLPRHQVNRPEQDRDRSDEHSAEQRITSRMGRGTPMLNHPQHTDSRQRRSAGLRVPADKRLQKDSGMLA